MAPKPSGIEISDVRKRVRAAIEANRRASTARQAERDLAAVAYQRFLSAVAGPVLEQVANVLRAEGFPFTVFTPKDGLRLSSTRSGEDYLELSLDISSDVSTVMVSVSRSRGHRPVRSLRTLREGVPIAELTEDDVLQAVLEEIGPLVER